MVMVNKLNKLDESSVYKSIFNVALVVVGVKFLGLIKEILIAKDFGMTNLLDAFYILILIPSFFKNVFIEAFKAVFIPNLVTVKDKNILKNNLFFLTVLLSVILIVLMALIIEPLNNYYTEKYPEGIKSEVSQFQYLFLILIPVWSFSALFSGFLDVKKKFVISAICPIISSLVFISASFLYRPSIKILVYATIIGSFLEMFFLLAFNKLSFNVRKINFVDSETRVIITQFLPKLLSGLVIGLNPVIDQVFTTRLSGGSVSTLNYGSKFPLLVISVLTIAIGNVLLPYFAEIKKFEKTKIFRILNNKIKMIFLISSLSVIFFLFFGDTLISLVFERGSFTSENVDNVNLVLKMFSFQIPFYLMDIILVRFLTANNLNKFNIISSLISVFVNVLCNYLFLEKYGVSGIALSTSIVILCSFLVKYFYIRNRLLK